MHKNLSIKLFTITIIIATLLFVYHIYKGDDMLIPRKILYGNQDKANVRINQNGKYITFIAPDENNVQNIWLAEIGNIDNARMITHDKKRGIRSYSWLHDNEHIIFSQDFNGDENDKLYLYNIAKNTTVLITPEKGVKAVLYAQSNVHKNEIIIGINDRDPRYFDAYRYNVQTGIMTLIFQNDKFSSLIFDHDLNLRFANYTNEEANEEIHQFIDGEFRLFMTVPFDDVYTTGIVGFNRSGDTMYFMDSISQNTGILKAWNLNNNTQTTIAEDARVDIDIFTADPIKYNIQAIMVNYTKPEIKVIDDDIKSDIQTLKSTKFGENFTILTRTADDKTWLIAYLSDHTPVQYCIYSKESKEIKFLFSQYKALEAFQLQPMEPVVLQSRDGLDMVSYITYPKDFISHNPMVLLVHGGPYGIRDNWGLNMTHQFLANRGYVVLSVNYRGSGGFGKNYINAGIRQWGRKMHDDLIDAVNWAIENKIADPKKIAIMGGSYGGYAALAGLTFTPDIFACGVDMVGPSNIVSLIQSFPKYWLPVMNNFKKRVGDINNPEDVKLMESQSPLFFVDKIIKPLFIAQGAHDPRVKQEESDQIVSAMKMRNIPVLYALYEDEGHGLVRQENKLSYYAITEQFLAEVLGGKFEKIGDDTNGANLILNDQKELKPQSVEILIHEATSR